MSKTVFEALHQVHTATNDVIEGYDTMLERAEPEIVATLADLTELHRRHASEQFRRLEELGQDPDEDTSLRGTMNSVVVTLRDWVTGLGEGSLDAVERGERALRDIYDDAMDNWPAAGDRETLVLLERQSRDIGDQIDRLQSS